MSPSDALLIFIKNPVKGHVKTRLAETIGDAQALEVYRRLLHYTRQVSLQVEAERQVWYSQHIDENDEWKAPAFTSYRQNGASLGGRMLTAFEKAFRQGHEKVVIIGSDCAQLQPAHLEKAYAELDEYDAVIGPSRDGGYYLLGLTRPAPALFKNIPWSTDRVLSLTKERCRKHELSFTLLEELNDVDTEDDWCRQQKYL